MGARALVDSLDACGWLAAMEAAGVVDQAVAELLSADCDFEAIATVVPLRLAG